MSKLKIIHTADFHLESSSFTPSNTNQVIMKAVRELVNIGLTESVDLLLIAGDLFDSSTLDARTLGSLQEALAEFKSPVFISPGNHDYFSMDSPYYHSVWPQNVHIFKGDLEQVILDDLNVAVYGAGFTGSYVRESSLLNFPGLDPTKINLGVIHGDLVSHTAESAYNPITKELIATTGLDYLALGHIHKRSPLLKSGKTSYAYSGNLVGRGFDELGSKGFYLGEIDKYVVKLEYIPINSPQYLIKDIDLTEVTTETEAVQKIINILEAEQGKDFANNHYRLILRGEATPDQSISWLAVRDRLADRFKSLEIQNKMSNKANLDLIRQDSNLKGIFVDLMLDATNTDESEKEIVQMALNFGLQAFEGEVNPNEY
ncbi:MAG: hypothetical protein GX326_03685 [Clostridiaceae bacterium]|nr:hypothetical protein [Clostridiaceae bacterium]